MIVRNVKKEDLRAVSEIEVGNNKYKVASYIYKL